MNKKQKKVARRVIDKLDSIFYSSKGDKERLQKEFLEKIALMTPEEKAAMKLKMTAIANMVKAVCPPDIKDCFSLEEQEAGEKRRKEALEALSK